MAFFCTQDHTQPDLASQRPSAEGDFPAPSKVESNSVGFKEACVNIDKVVLPLGKVTPFPSQMMVDLTSLSEYFFPWSSLKFTN